MKKKPKVQRTFDIENIESPEFLKQLNIDELEALCADIRKFIVSNVSETGGHLSSNLGAVEAIVAMHYVFDSPKDKFLFDVGHQIYTHKILTGRAKQFKNLRKRDGLSGFASYDESIHDVLETGHSSSTISAACGFLEAKEVDDSIGEVIAFIGDGAIQNGLAFEGLNYLGSQKNQKLIVIVNDNEMSISKNVGRLAKSFSKMRIRKGYNGLKRITPMFIRRGLNRLVSSIRTFVYGKNLFTTMGYKYFGPIDGHNIKELVEYFKFAKKCDESVILKINTIKGKGYEFAENDKEGKWHGVSKFNVETGEIYKDNKISWSKYISEILEDHLKQDNTIRIISPATLVGTCLSKLKEEYPNEVIDVGINEEHACVMAASMARGGIKPIISIYSTFLQRSYDYLVNDIDRVNAHVVFLIDRAGLVAEDGSTHQGIFDVSMLAPLFNFEISMPSNDKEAKALLEYGLNKCNHPFALRYPKCNLVTSEEELIIDKPKWLILNDIKDINILSYGDNINYLKDLVDDNIGLINCLFIKPLDEEILEKLNNTKIIIVEEVVKNSSLYSLILEKINEKNLNIIVYAYNVNDYPSVGTREQLQSDNHLDKDSIKQKIEELRNK